MVPVVQWLGSYRKYRSLWRRLDADSYTDAYTYAHSGTNAIKQATSSQHLCQSDFGNQPASRNFQLCGE